MQASDDWRQVRKQVSSLASFQDLQEAERRTIIRAFLAGLQVSAVPLVPSYALGPCTPPCIIAVLLASLPLHCSSLVHRGSVSLMRLLAVSEVRYPSSCGRCWSASLQGINAARHDLHLLRA